MSEHELWNELGNLYYLCGSYNQAIRAYNRSIQLENRFGRPYSNLALANVQQGKLVEAVELYQAGIERLVDTREKAISWYRLGDVYRCMKNYRDAILAYQQGDLLDPSLSQDGQELGELLYGSSESMSAPVPSKEENTSSTLSSANENDDPGVNYMDETRIGTGSANFSPDKEREMAIQQSEATPVPEFEKEYFSFLFEQEPKPDEIAENEFAEWLFTSNSEHPEEDGMSARGTDALIQEPLPIDHSANHELGASDNFSSRSVAEVTSGRSDLLTLVDTKIKEPLNLMVVETTTPEANTNTMEETPLLSVFMVSDEKYLVQQDRPAAEILPEIKDVPSDKSKETTVETALELVVVKEEDKDSEIVEMDEDPTREDDEHSGIPDDVAAEINRLQEEVDLDPQNADAWQELGDLQKSIRLYSDALYSYQQSVACEPKNVEHLHRLGMMYAIEGLIEEAIRTLQKILISHPHHGLAHASLSGYYRKMGMEELSQKHLLIALNTIQKSENEYNRACLEALSGNVDNSLALLRVALEENQTTPDWALNDPDLDGIRMDPRFNELITELS